MDVITESAFEEAYGDMLSIEDIPPDAIIQYGGETYIIEELIQI